MSLSLDFLIGLKVKLVIGTVAEKIFLKTIQLITHQSASSVFNKILIYLKINNINSPNKE